MSAWDIAAHLFRVRVTTGRWVLLWAPHILWLCGSIRQNGTMYFKLDTSQLVSRWTVESISEWKINRPFRKRGHGQASSSFLACNSRLRSAVRRHHPPQRAVLRQICCFWECKVVIFQILWTVLSHVMQGQPSCLLQSVGGEANRILLASALSSMHIICPNRVSQRDWIKAVSLGCFVSLCTSSFRTNWYHLMLSSICRHHWSSASILFASILDIAQQSEPYRNIGKIHVLYSFNFVELCGAE